MQVHNHVAGGFAVTGIFCSLADINIFDRADTMLIVCGAAMLPDIDHQKSLIGKAFWFISGPVQRKHGHRTITHSIFFFVAIVCIVQGLDNLFHNHFTLPVALALGSHLLFDMCTKQGIKLFYPFLKIPVVMPADDKLRLSGNDYRSEAVIFLIFLGLNFFSYPLMAQGFWTRYNRGFATYDHLERETLRKPGDYAVMVLSAENDTTVGLLVEQKPSEIILYHEKQKKFLRIETAKYKLLNFLKRKRGKHEFRTINLLQVSTDSLNTYMKLPVVKVTAQSDSNAIYYFEGPLMKQGTELTADYPNGPRFQQLAIDNSQTEYEIQMLDNTYRKAQRKYAQDYGKYRADIVELKELSLQTGLSDFEEGKRRVRVLELSERVKTVVPPEPVDANAYQIRRAMLEHKMKETAHINATILVWQAQQNQN